MGSEAARSGEPRGLLEGVQVIDLTHYLSGPYCTKLLATLGADVVKIERPGNGDPARRIGPFANPSPSPSDNVILRSEATKNLEWGLAHNRLAQPPQPLPPDSIGAQGDRWEGTENLGEHGAWFLYLNTSKKSVTLDLKMEAGRDILRRLVRSAHIVVENFAPSTLDKLGLGYEDLRRSNPALVMTSISNYGQTGPYRDWKAAEINLYAASGLMNITGEPDLEPLKEGTPLVQLGAGQNAFVATMAALLYAEDTGQGQHIDVSIAEYGTNILENALMQYSYSGQEFTRVGNRGYGRAAWGIYPCRDGYVGIIAGPDHRWPEMAKVMEREELADPRFASRYGRLVHADEVDALMLPWLLDHDKVEIFKAGQERGLGFAFVATMQDILGMEQLKARDYFVELDHPVAGTLKYPGPPVRLTPSVSSPYQGGETEGVESGGWGDLRWVYRRAPLLGEHTREILQGRLGYSDGEIDRLHADGVI